MSSFASCGSAFDSCSRFLLIRHMRQCTHAHEYRLQCICKVSISSFQAMDMNRMKTITEIKCRCRNASPDQRHDGLSNNNHQRHDVNPSLINILITPPIHVPRKPHSSSIVDTTLGSPLSRHLHISSLALNNFLHGLLLLDLCLLDRHPPDTLLVVLLKCCHAVDPQPAVQPSVKD